MLKVSLYDFDRTIYAKDTGTQLYLFMFKERPFLILFTPLFGLFTLLHLLRLLSHRQWKSLLLLPMTFFPLGHWRDLVSRFWQREQARLFPRVLEEIAKDKDSGMIVGIISASLELYLEPLSEIIGPDFIIGTKVFLDGEHISRRLDGLNCKEAEKVRRFRAHMEQHYPGQEYVLEKMVSDSLHDLPLYESARTAFTVEADGSLRPGLPAAYSNDLIVK